MQKVGDKDIFYFIKKVLEKLATQKAKHESGFLRAKDTETTLKAI